MKYNLVFMNIYEVASEDSVVRGEISMKDLLHISDIRVDSSHRLGRWRANSTRPMTVISVTDRVVKAASRLSKPHFSIHEQLPAEIETQRKQLHSVMRDARNNGDQARMRRDLHRLYIDIRVDTPTEYVQY